jgi:hypothetical protein
MGKRVVCGRSPAGAWTILADGPPPGPVALEVGGSLTYLWTAPELALDTSEVVAAPQSVRPVGLHIGESRFSICDFPPTPAPGWWHRNNTIDYQYVMAGSILLELEDGTHTTLEAGDTNIQLGGTHRWWNNNSGSCRMAIVQIGVDAGDLQPYNERAGARP